MTSIFIFHAGCRAVVQAILNQGGEIDLGTRRNASVANQTTSALWEHLSLACTHGLVVGEMGHYRAMVGGLPPMPTGTLSERLLAMLAVTPIANTRDLETVLRCEPTLLRQTLHELSSQGLLSRQLNHGFYEYWLSKKAPKWEPPPPAPKPTVWSKLDSLFDD